MVHFLVFKYLCTLSKFAIHPVSHPLFPLPFLPITSNVTLLLTTPTNVSSPHAGIEAKFKKRHFPVLVMADAVPELNKLELKDEGLEVGASVTLARLDTYLQKLINDLPGLYCYVLRKAPFLLKLMLYSKGVVYSSSVLL